MASDNKDEMSKLQSACLALSRLLAKEGRNFTLQIKVGDQFSFCVESGMRIPAQRSTKNENRKKRKKSPSGIDRDRRRRIEFLKRKGIFLTSAASDQESGRMEKLNTVSHRAQDEGGTTGRIYDSHDAQNKESPGVVEEGLRTKDMDGPMSLDEVRTNLMKLQASTTEIVLRAQNNLRLLGIAELKK